MEYTGYNFGYALIGVIIYVIMLIIAKPQITYKNPTYMVDGIRLWHRTYSYKSTRECLSEVFQDL